MRHTLILLDYFHPFIGGIETLFDDVTKFCSEKDMKITVLTSRHSAVLKKAEKRGDVTIYRVGKSRFTIFFAALWFALTHRELIKSIDHIHTSTFAACIPAWIIGKMTKKPVTITIHEIYDTLRYHLKGWKARFYIGFESLVCHLPWSHIITPSQASKSTLQKIYPHLTDEKINVIPNQINEIFWDPKHVTKEEQTLLRQSHNISGADRNFLFIGRLGKEKGLPYLIEAFSQIIAEHKNTKLIIIAPRSETRYLELKNSISKTRKQIKDNYLTQHIVWIDPVKDNETLRLRISISGVGIVPSMSEGFCYTAVQMQAMGLAMIASEVGALPEVLHHDTTTFVPYGKVKPLNDALEKATNNKQGTTNNKSQNINYHEYYELFKEQKNLS